MPAALKVFPATEDAPLAHPESGPLPPEGALWVHDAFTQRHLLKGTIRRAEQGEADHLADSLPEPPTVDVLPCSPDHIGICHPIAGALLEQGSRWPLDQFTQKRLLNGMIRRAEAGTARKVAAK